MHELAVTEHLLEVALSHAANRRVTDLHLVIGQLSSIVDDSVQFYWDFVSAGTVCEGARLHFQRIPATFQCLACGQTYTLTDTLEACPHCQSIQIRVLSGEEFRLESIDIEESVAIAELSSV